MCPKSFGGLRFDLRFLLQGRMWSLIPLMVYISLMVGRRGFRCEDESFGGVTFDIIFCLSRFNHVKSRDILHRDAISSFPCLWERVLLSSFLMFLLPSQFFCAIVSPKSGLWITHGHRPLPCPQRFSCVQPTSHISFGISFKLCKWLTMAEIWPPYCFGRPGVKIRLWGVKNI